MTAVKKRLDVLLVERGLADSRAQAQALVLAGLVPGHSKPGRAGRRRRRAHGRRARRASSPAAARSSRTRSARSASTPPEPTASTSAPRPAASPTACCSAARRASSRSTSATGSSTRSCANDPRVTVLERTNARARSTRSRSLPSSSPATSRSSRVRTALPPVLRAGGAGLAGARPRQAAVRGRPRRGAEGRRPRPCRPPARAARGGGSGARLGSWSTGRGDRRLRATRPEGQP